MRCQPPHCRVFCATPSCPIRFPSHSSVSHLYVSPLSFLVMWPSHLCSLRHVACICTLSPWPLSVRPYHTCTLNDPLIKLPAPKIPSCLETFTLHNEFSLAVVLLCVYNHVLWLHVLSPDQPWGTGFAWPVVHTSGEYIFFHLHKNLTSFNPNFSQINIDIISRQVVQTAYACWC